MSVIYKLKIDFKNFTLDIPELELLDQGVNVIWGNSGSGKSTLLKSLVGFIPSDMEWVVGDVDLGKLSVRERRLGLVTQDSAVFPHLTVLGNLRFVLKSRSIPQENWQELIQKTLKQVRMEEKLNQRALTLSGGERQRLALAMAVISNPRVLLLDEPFSSLDFNVRHDARQLVLSVIEALNLPCILVTHDKEDVEAMAQRTIQLSEGRIDSQK